jgi:hypothetical protein
VILGFFIPAFMRKTAPGRERKTWPAGKKNAAGRKKKRGLPEKKPAGRKKNRRVGGFCEKRRGGDVIDLWPAGRVRGVSTLRYRLAQKSKEITKYNTKGLQTRMFVAHRKLLHRTAEKTSIAENEYYIKPVSTRALSKSCCYALGAHSLTHTHTRPHRWRCKACLPFAQMPYV